MGIITFKPGYIRHSWPEKPGLSIYRPNGTFEYSFLHFWNSFEINLNGKTFKTKPHACIIFKKGTPQIFSSEEASTQDWFRMRGDVEEIIHKYGIEFDTIYYPKNYDFITSLTRKMELEFTVKGKYFSELCNAYLDQLFIELSREISTEQTSISVNSQTKEHLKTLRLQLSLEYDKKWCIDDMAKFVNLSPSYLYATYKRYYGVSPMHDLIAIRMQQAMTLLNDSQKTVNEIAEILGYPNSSHFIRQFTKYKGISPLKYRQRNLIEDRRLSDKIIGKLKFTVLLPSIASINVNITAKRLRITLYFIAIFISPMLLPEVLVRYPTKAKTIQIKNIKCTRYLLT